MKDDFLTPLGITSAVMGKSSLTNLQPEETKYYGQGGTKGFEYNLNIERRDGDGGLVINASDLLKFVTAIDGNPSRPDILDATTYQKFIQGSGAAPLDPNFGNGIVNVFIHRCHPEDTPAISKKSAVFEPRSRMKN